MSEPHDMPADYDRLLKAFAAGSTVAEMRNILPEELESVYSIAYTYYQTGRLEDAEKLFRFLCLFDHTVSKYWLALGAVLQAERKFKDAIRPYACTLMFDRKEVRAAFHLAECQLAIGEHGEAIAALDILDGIADAKTERGRDYLARGRRLREQCKLRK